MTYKLRQINVIGIMHLPCPSYSLVILLLVLVQPNLRYPLAISRYDVTSARVGVGRPFTKHVTDMRAGMYFQGSTARPHLELEEIVKSLVADMSGFNMSGFKPDPP